MIRGLWSFRGLENKILEYFVNGVVNWDLYEKGVKVLYKMHKKSGCGNLNIPPARLELAVSRLEGGRLIHWATGATCWLMGCARNLWSHSYSIFGALFA